MTTIRRIIIIWSLMLLGMAPLPMQGQPTGNSSTKENAVSSPTEGVITADFVEEKAMMDDLLQMLTRFGQYMMADFQFCYCRKEILAESLEAIGLRFEVSGQGGKEIRQIWDKDKLVIQVEREKNRTKLQNLLREYSYDILEGN